MKFLAAQIVLALEYLPTCRILNRDLEPANIMVFEHGYLKLGDFGLAKKVCERTDTWLGSLHFMTPGIVAKINSHGSSVDWWAFSVMLFQVVFDEYPFTDSGWNLQKNMQMILSKPLEFPELPAYGEALDLIENLI